MAIRKVVVTWDGWRDRVLEKARAEGLTDVEFVISSDRDEIMAAAGDADAAFIAVWDAEIHRRATRLRWIHAVSGGVTGYLFPELVESDIPFTCGKPCFAIPGAEFALGAMLMFSRRNHVAMGSRPLTQRDGSQEEVLAPEDLAGKTLGVLGMGGMGQALAPRAKAMGMEVLGSARRPRAAPEGVDRMFTADELPQMLAMSDYVVVAVPIAPATEHLVDERLLDRMKTSAYLIDCSGRAAIYDYVALERAIVERRIAGVCLQPGGVTPDVPPADSPFWANDGVVVTPCRGTSVEQEEMCLALFFENLRRFEEGQPLDGLVDKKAGY